MKKPSSTMTAVLSAGVCAAAAATALTLPWGSGAGTFAAAGPAAHQSARISFNPPDGATGVAPGQNASVSVSGGHLESVAMDPAAGGADGSGALSPDGTHWSSGGTLAPGTAYTVHAAALAGGASGTAVTQDASFTTVPASDVLHATVTPSDSSTVGVGMPVSVTFDKPVAVADQGTVQQHIKVTSTSGQQVLGHWFGPNRLDFRPEAFWQPGSKVDVQLALGGVSAGPAAMGVQNSSEEFTVGRSQISTVDVAAKTMAVVRDGTPLKTLPVSAGSPEHATYDGTMVISSKSLTTAMDGATVGLLGPDGKPQYDIPDVPHAMRLTDSGTFVHGNYWAAPQVFGQEDTSHGCIGLSDVEGGKDPNTPAAWFYDNSLVGDVVIVKNSGGTAVQPGNGLSDWNLDWSQWNDGSAAG
ncbi:L,D-transpeptidase [Streptomyces sp. NBC_01264]|uniref:L,D-transpeptidase n=1 Tax=Streptomyces sp. NBC_01264 TaxID=2903804 RepID=UPI002258D212|nr:Ig-like domain-containing protein [Streptomyces sp. NBC_01264]MCX4781811.1 Ig-like domain-containing protein [Streptomyces sp. NBC_01264]